MVAPMAGYGGVCVWQEMGVWSQTVVYVLVVGESGYSRNEGVFAFNLLYKDNL
jgi:hypothetical protein